MNNDPFEDQLRSQPLRQPPADWRKDILAAAARQAKQESTSPHPSVSWWRTLFWPAPQAWAGLAAVWVVILGLQYLTGGDSPASQEISQISPSRQVQYALHEKQRLYAELLSEMDTNTVAEPPRRFVPGPRSQGVPTMVVV